MSRKSLLFVCYGLGIGGIEKCLVNLLNTLPEENYEVDLLVMDPIYDMLPQIRRKIHMVDPFEYTLNTEITMQEIRKRGGISKHLDKLLPYLVHRIRIKLGLPLWVQFKPIEKHYDVAVAYSQNGIGPYYVADKIQANRKVLWYHNGAYERTGKEYALDRKYYGKFDFIVAVSEDCAKILRNKFPDQREKIMVLHNICDVQDIREKAAVCYPDTFAAGKKHIVTVGRLSREKGAFLALEACNMLREKQYDICWHWVGDGNQKTEIQEKICQLGLAECFCLEGNQSNPYPYILNADIYVQPSFYEAYSTTVTEAKVLYRPIVATDVGGMRDQLVDGKTARIVPVDASAIAEAIAHMLDEDGIMLAFSDALKQKHCQCADALEEYERSVFA